MLWNLTRRIFSRKVLLAAILLGFVFLLSGGVGALITYLNGASSFEEFVNGLTFPFMAGFLAVGLMGAVKLFRERDSKSCLYGLLILVIAYVCIEVLFGSVGGA